MKRPQLTRKTRIAAVIVAVLAVLTVAIAANGSSSDTSNTPSVFSTSSAPISTSQTTPSTMPSATDTGSVCAGKLLALHSIDVDMDNLASKMSKMGPDDQDAYDNALTEFEGLQGQFRTALREYNAARCDPEIGEDIIRTPPPRPTISPTPQAYPCEMPAVNYKPPVAAPSDNAGTRFSDGSPNCACARLVMDRLEELHEHYLEQEDLYGPGGPMYNAVLYNATVAFDASTQSSWGLYDYFCTINNCPVS